MSGHQTQDIHCFVTLQFKSLITSRKGIKLNTDYATILPDSEQQKSSVKIQAVEKHLQDYPDIRKSTQLKFKPCIFDLDNWTYCWAIIVQTFALPACSL